MDPDIELGLAGEMIGEFQTDRLSGRVAEGCRSGSLSEEFPWDKQSEDKAEFEVKLVRKM